MVLRIWLASCDLRLLAGPVRFAQLPLEDLAGRRLGQRLGAQLDALGILNPAIRSRQCAISSSGVTSCAGNTTA